MGLALALLLLIEAISAVGGSDYREIVQASEILAKIQKGSPVQYDNAIVRGNLDLNQIALPEMRANRTVFETKILGLSQDANLIISPIEMRNVTFEGNTNFENAVFYGSVDFSGSNFTSFAKFHGAQFGAYAYDFSDIGVFGGEANFNNVKFCEGVDFVGVSGLAKFMDTEFEGDVALFWGAKLYNAWFSRAKFYTTDTDFRKAQFIGIASFSEALFSSEPNFEKAQFKSDTDFIGTEFKGKSHFVDSMFNMNADFTNSKFGAEAIFNGAKFNGYFIGWNNIEDVFKGDEATYLGLIQNFKKHGQFSDADNCYYSYMNWILDQNSGFSKLSDYISWAISGYGVKPWRPIIFGISILLIFSIFYFLLIKKINYTDAVWFSMSALLSLPKDISDYKTFIDNQHRGLSLIRYLYIIERLIGWGLLVIFINTLTRVMIRY